MAGNFAEQKAKARRAVHAAFAYSATYQDGSLDTPVPVTVRWHNKLVIMGDFQESGYANIVEGIESIIFNREELELVEYTNNGLALQGLLVNPHGVVTITEPGFDNAQLILAVREPHVGPIEEKWKVTRTGEA